MKIFVDLFHMLRFAVSWEFPPLSLIVAVGYMTGVLFFSMEYLPLYLLVSVILILCTTYILRKKHLIAKTIQTTDVTEDSYYVDEIPPTHSQQLTSALINIVNTPVNQMKNTLSGATLVLFAANLSFSVMEKLYHLCIWTHPVKTRFFLMNCIILAIFAMIIPLRVILFLVGCCVLFPVVEYRENDTQKKVNLFPFFFSIMNFLNSVPDDDQVYDVGEKREYDVQLLCPTPQFTLTMDGTQQHLNRGYCKYFFDCMIVNPELSTWSVRVMLGNHLQTVYIAIGYDGLVRKWKSESDVDHMKGLVLFHISSVASVSKELTARDLACYGITENVDRTPTTENSLAVTVSGRTNPVVLSFKDNADRDLFMSAIINKYHVCKKQLIHLRIELPSAKLLHESY